MRPDTGVQVPSEAHVQRLEDIGEVLFGQQVSSSSDFLSHPFLDLFLKGFARKRLPDIGVMPLTCVVYLLIRFWRF